MKKLGLSVWRRREALRVSHARRCLYSLGGTPVARIFDVLHNPQPWDELWEALDPDGRDALMRLLRASLASLFQQPWRAYTVHAGIDVDEYLESIDQARVQCKPLDEREGICIYRVRGRRGRLYTIAVTPSIYTAIWIYNVYPEPRRRPWSL